MAASTKRLMKLREDRGRVIQASRAIIDEAERSAEGLSDEQRAKLDELHTQQDKLRADVELEERQIELERQAAELELNKGKGGDDDLERVATLDDAGAPRVIDLRSHPRAQPNYRRAFNRALIGGVRALTEGELRAMQAGSDAEGGYLIAPVQMVQGLLKNLDNLVFIRGKATKFQLTSAAKLGQVTLDTDMDDADWTTELATGNEDTALRLGRRDMETNPFAKRVKISRTLLRMTGDSAEGLVRQRLEYKFGVTEEKAYLAGSGVGQPLGLFTAHANGISTGRDVSTGNTTTAIQGDGLIEAKYSLKSPYWARAEWLFHRDAVKQISKLKDGDGQYLWQPGLQAGQPDRLLSFPLNVSEYVPNTFTTGLYVGMLGDFSFYWVVDSLELQIQVLLELYAETNQNGYIGLKEGDGAPVLEEAFARVKLA